MIKSVYAFKAYKNQMQICTRVVSTKTIAENLIVRRFFCKAIYSFHKRDTNHYILTNVSIKRCIRPISELGFSGGAGGAQWSEI